MLSTLRVAWDRSCSPLDHPAMLVLFLPSPSTKAGSLHHSLSGLGWLRRPGLRGGQGWGQGSGVCEIFVSFSDGIKKQGQCGSPPLRSGLHGVVCLASPVLIQTLGP
jgi:hypothetical protein